jgi:hypothetical protein
MKTNLNREAYFKQLYEVNQDILAFTRAKDKYEEKLLKAKMEDARPNVIQGFKNYKVRNERAIMYAKEYKKQLNLQYQKYIEDWKKDLMEITNEDNTTS